MKKIITLIFLLLLSIWTYFYFFSNKNICKISDIDVIKLNNFFESWKYVWNKSYWCNIKMINPNLSLWKKLIPELWKLVNLENLILNDKKIFWEIPSEIWNLKNLKVLWLSNNNLTWEIPKTIINLKKLNTLSLLNNKNLTWGIPKEILKQLERLDIKNTKILVDENLSKNIKYLNK